MFRVGRSRESWEEGKSWFNASMAASVELEDACVLLLLACEVLSSEGELSDVLLGVPRCCRTDSSLWTAVEVDGELRLGRELIEGVEGDDMNR